MSIKQGNKFFRFIITGKINVSSSHDIISRERIIITISTPNRTMTDVCIKVLTIVIVN